jgi:ATP-dependent helicase/nuclease subunit A
LSNGLEDYEPLTAHHPQVNASPCIEFLWSPREAKENVTEARSHEADWIARRIAAMVTDREALVVERDAQGERLRPVRPGDVVLLFRAMSNVELYEAALRNYGLDYYLVGGRAFFAQQEIYDLLNLLRALENPQDAVSLAGTLRSPFCCLSDEALFLLGRHKDGLWAGLHDDATCARLADEQQPRAQRARRHLDRWRAVKDRQPIALLLQEVFADSGYDAATQFEFLGDRKLANLWKLQDLARNFDRSGLFGLADFIGRLGDLVRTQPREEQAATQPENADVVRLMSIHQAKGLEFPVVIVPDLAAAGGGARLPVAHWDARLGCVVRPPADDPPPFTEFGWRLWEAGEAVEDWREDLRTLYVACTRAQDYLVLSAALPDHFSPQNSWMLLLTERFDLRSGRCLDAGRPAEQVPPVRVTDVRTPPTMVKVPRSLSREPRASAGALARGSRLNGGSSCTEARVMTIAELEALTQDSAVLPYQFDAEDGSDRSAWVLPGERLDASTATPCDRLLRLVLERWDFCDPDGWRPLLDAEAASMGLAKEDLECLLMRFGSSEICRQLAAAPTCLKQVEYLVPFPEDRKASGAQLLVRGVIDCLWQDAAGDWHVLAFTVERHSAAGWQRHLPSLLCAALAVRDQQRDWPKTAGRCYVDQTVTVSRGRLPQKQIVTAVRAALNRSPLGTN